MINGNITLHQFEQNKRTHPFGSAEIADKGIYMYIQDQCNYMGEETGGSG